MVAAEKEDMVSSIKCCREAKYQLMGRGRQKPWWNSSAGTDLLEEKWQWFELKRGKEIKVAHFLQQ